MTSNPAEAVSVARVIRASPQAIFAAFTSAETMAGWRAPQGMKARMLAFDARQGGGYRMALDYVDGEHSTRGKTTAHSDVVDVRFAELVADQRIVEQARFESSDPAFAGTMTITTTLTEAEGGTRVAVCVDNAPRGIDPRDHEAGISSSLENLAALVE